MAPPTSPDQYNQRFKESHRLSGEGLGTVQHMPCPFCAAPDFVAFKILEMEPVMSKGATCGECGRSVKAIYTRTPETTTFELVQTGGDDPPNWVPRLRRIDDPHP